MLLGFKTKWNGEPTRFVEKILCPYTEDVLSPKIHTIRKGNRWKVGNKIHMATGIRTKDYNQFNKGFDLLSVCKGVQDIEILCTVGLEHDIISGYSYAVKIPSRYTTPYYKICSIKIDGRLLSDSEIKEFAINDGFKNPDDLFKWFDYQDFKGQIIHWSDKKY